MGLQRPSFSGMRVGCFYGRVVCWQRGLNVIRSIFPFFPLLVIMLVSYSASAEEKMADQFPRPPLVWNNQLDATPLQIRVSGHRLRIPRNYFVRGGIAPNGQAGFVLMAEYPDFSGITEENFSMFSGLSEGELRYMMRGTTAITPNIITIYRVDRYYEKRRKIIFHVATVAGEKSSIDGLVRIPHMYNGEYVPGVLDFTYAHVTDGGNNDVIIDCLSSDENKTYDDFESGKMTTVLPSLQDCHTDIYINDVAFEYHFYFSLLRKWKEVNRGVLSLLSGFFED